MVGPILNKEQFYNCSLDGGLDWLHYLLTPLVLVIGTDIQFYEYIQKEHCAYYAEA